ncbi:MAG: hypothetical protein ACOCZK_00530 [Planctomycetota bacterium]
MTTCSDLDRLATALADGDLLPPCGRTAPADHLAVCPACRERLAALDPLSGVALEAPPPPPSPEELAPRIVAVATPELARRRQASPVRRWWEPLTPGLRLAAAAL